MYFKKNPYLQLARFSWGLDNRYRISQICCYAVYLISIAIPSVNPLLYKWLIDQIQNTNNQIKSIWIFAGISVFIKILEWLLYAPVYFKTRNIGFELSAKFLVDLQSKVMGFSTRWHQLHHTGASVNRIKKSSDALKKFLNDDFHYLKVFFRFMFALFGMIYFAPLYGLIALIVGAGIVYLTTMLDHKYLKQLTQINEREYVATAVLLDNLSNHQTIKSLNLNKQVTANYYQKVRELAVPYFKSVKIDALKWAIVEILVVLIYVIVAVGYVYDHYQPGQKFMVGGLVAMLAYAVQFTSGFQDMAWLYAMVVGTYADFSTTEDLRSIQIETFDNEQKEEKYNWNTLKLCDINYSHYADGIHKFSLTGLELNIRNGQKIAIIGASGSGKSTLMRLIRGLYTPDSGAAALDQKVIKWENLEQLVSFLPQEAEIFNDTILYNLSLGSKLDIKQIQEVCKLTSFDQVIARLPEGFNTVITQRGSNLSGGERQLLAITRLILLDKSCSLLLFDEPTSSLDPSREALLMKNMFNYYQDRTLIFSLHRHYLLPMFDYIYVMDSGSITWHGNYQQMMLRDLTIECDQKL